MNDPRTLNYGAGRTEPRDTALRRPDGRLFAPRTSSHPPRQHFGVDRRAESVRELDFQRGSSPVPRYETSKTKPMHSGTMQSQPHDVRPIFSSLRTLSVTVTKPIPTC
jgi:hypothetical protein